MLFAGCDGKSRQRNEKVGGMGTAGDFAAGETVAYCLVGQMSGEMQLKVQSGRKTYLHDRLAGEGISDFFTETRSVGLRHDE